MRKKISKGFTLVELSVSIAVIAIVATALVAFTSMMSVRVSLNRAAYQAAADAELIRARLDQFIFGSQQAITFSVSEDGSLRGDIATSATSQEDTEESAETSTTYGTASGSGKTFTVSYSDEANTPYTVTTTGTFELSFQVLPASEATQEEGDTEEEASTTSSTADKQLVVCKISYTMSSVTTQFVYCFTVYSAGGAA